MAPMMDIVYPNPADGLLNIDLARAPAGWYRKIVDIMVESYSYIKYSYLEDTITWKWTYQNTSGVYMINFAGTKDYIKESRMVKQ